jgi:ppGpp synthetase/RelA/SpoT-type nucleotidyltranferase
MMPEDFFKKNVEMWEQFTSQYMDTMFKTVERTMEQSTSFKEQMDKAVQDTVSAQMKATMSALEALQRQVELLNEKVDKMMKDQG